MTLPATSWSRSHPSLSLRWINLPIPWWRETVCEKVFYQYRYRCIPQKPKKEKYLFGIWRILNPDPMLNRPLPVLIVFLFLCERLGGAFAYHPSEYQTSPNVISHLGSKCTPLWFQWSEKTNWTMTLLQAHPDSLAVSLHGANLQLRAHLIILWQYQNMTYILSVLRHHTSVTLHYLHCVTLFRHIIYIIHQISCRMS